MSWLSKVAASQVIAYGRLTNLLTDDLVRSYVAAQQIQVSRDFAPLWGADATCIFVPGGEIVPAGAWQVRFEDHSPDAGDLGFHLDDGTPMSRVFVADDLAAGSNWCVTGSHETLEMLGDPTIDKTVDVGNIEYSWENCDAVEDDHFGYWIAGIDGKKHLLSDFVLPSWFNPQGVAPFSFRNNVHAPFELAEGGYIGFRDLPNGQWRQRFAQGIPGARAANKGPSSRTIRRFSR